MRWCSDACRRRGVTAEDRAIEERLRAAIGTRGAVVEVEAGEPVRRAARRLAASGEAEIVQGGRVVDPSTAKGPVRIRRAR